MKTDRPCTCHPEDDPPVPCQHKYALGECIRSERDGLRRMLDDHLLSEAAETMRADKAVGNLAAARESEAKAERERDHAWETCKRALHKVDNLIACAEKAEKDRDATEAERDDAIHTAQDNAAEVDELKADLAAVRALLRDLRDGDHVYGNDSEPLLIRIDSILEGDAK